MATLADQLSQIRKEKHLDYLVKNDILPKTKPKSNVDYDIVIDFTANHLMTYTEESIPKSCLITHRHMHTILEDETAENVITTKTYDIRELLKIRHQKFTFGKQTFYLRPSDQERIDAMKMCLLTSPVASPKKKIQQRNADTIFDEIYH
jgi:hypothetical protein